MGTRQRAWLHDAARTAFGDRGETPPWTAKLGARQASVRRLYLAQARLLSLGDAEDKALGRAVEAFVRQMPAPDTQRLALARALREANARSRGEERGGDPGPGRDRSR